MLANLRLTTSASRDDSASATDKPEETPHEKLSSIRAYPSHTHPLSPQGPAGFRVATMNEPSDILRSQLRTHVEGGTAVTLVSTRTGIGYHKLVRWLTGKTVTIGYNDAVKLEKYLSGEGE